MRIASLDSSSRHISCDPGHGHGDELQRKSVEDASSQAPDKSSQPDSGSVSSSGLQAAVLARKFVEDRIGRFDPGQDFIVVFFLQGEGCAVLQLLTDGAAIGEFRLAANVSFCLLNAEGSRT
jgi:hypothetical protein